MRFQNIEKTTQTAHLPFLFHPLLIPFFLLLTFVSGSGSAFGQIQTINPNSLISNGPAILNYNFSWLNQNKPTLFTGTGVPGLIVNSVLGNFYTDLGGQNLYQCYSLTCSTGTPVWIKVSGTGGGSSYTFTLPLQNNSGTVSLQVPLAVAYGGNGSTTPSITGTGAISVSGSWPNYTISYTGGNAVWGQITGSISAQTDLQAALAAKQNTLTLPLSITNGGNGTSTPNITAGSNITVSGTWGNYTISATGGGGSLPNTPSSPVGVWTVTGNNSAGVVAISTPALLPAVQNGLGTTQTGTGNTMQVNVSLGVRAVTATSDTILATDCGGLVTYNNASAVAVALPQAGLGGNFLAGCPITVRNYGAGTVTITPSTSTINNGAGSLAVSQNVGVEIVSDGTNYQMGPGGGSGGGGMVYPSAGIANSTGSSWGTSYGTSGSGTTLALTTSPTFTTPALGTPSAAVLTNATGLPLATGVTGILPVANGGNGTATPGIVAGTNVTVSGTWPTQTINATGGGSSTWSGLGNPSANLALTMGSYTSTFTWGSSTGSNNLWTFADSASNTGTGYLMTIAAAASSTIKPFQVTSGGTQVLWVDQFGIANASTLKSTTLTVNNSYQVNYQGHVLYLNTAAITCGTGAGTSPTCGGTANDGDGVFSITTGTSPSANATVATSTFQGAWASAPYCVISPANQATAALSGATAVYANPSTTALVITSGTTALAASTAYKWFYHCSL